MPHTAAYTLLANIAAGAVSAFYNYSMNCRFVFHTKRKAKTAAHYFALAGFILIMNNLILGMFTQVFRLSVYPAKLLTECILFIFSWLIQKFVIFRKKRILWIAVDLTMAALVVLVVWIVNYKISSEIQPDSLIATNVVMDTQDWHEKFADKFTDTVVATDTSYSSPDLSIQLSYSHYDTGILDESSEGKHIKYGTEVSYVLADIYVGDIACFRTAFAQDTYGVVYRNERTDMETCVLNWDGTMDIYSPDQIDFQQLIEKGAYQSWIFGPSLLDENGKAKESFLTWSYIRQSHPRTALGYFEPGHYCLLLVDGRQKSSRGMFLEEMAKVFEDLGCRAAYNLDGGHCSFMTFGGRTANHPYKPEHEVSDGIFICAKQ